MVPADHDDDAVATPDIGTVNSIGPEFPRFRHRYDHAAKSRSGKPST